MQPMPNAATAVRTAKITPSHFAFIPRSRTYMGPPPMSPDGVTTRYFTASTASAYLVAMPKTPVSHIHNTAPGPPAATAVATPTMLPVPMVAASAVMRAPNCETSPSPSLSRRKEMRMAVPQVALDEPQPHGQEQVGAEQQHEERWAPHDVGEGGEGLLDSRHRHLGRRSRAVS